MKDLTKYEKYRQRDKEKVLYGAVGDDKNGIFVINVLGSKYNIVASDGGGWEHVSVSPVKGNQCPIWNVMAAIKDMFFEPEEVVVEFHPAKSQYVNLCETCLHLWRLKQVIFPTPPLYMV